MTLIFFSVVLYICKYYTALAQDLLQFFSLFSTAELDPLPDARA